MPFKWIYGTIEDDHLIGSALEDVFECYMGDDSVLGMAGGDVLRGHEGNDTLRGGFGHDYIDGGSGSNFLSGDQGNDTIIGASHLLYENMRPGADIIFGGDGNDSIYGSSSASIVYGGNGNDTISLGDADGWAYRDNGHGGAGNDLVLVYSPYSQASGGDGYDVLLFADYVSKAGRDYRIYQTSLLIEGIAVAQGFEEISIGLTGEGNDTVRAGFFLSKLVTVDYNTSRTSLNGGNGIDHLYLDYSTSDATGRSGISVRFGPTTSESLNSVVVTLSDQTTNKTELISYETFNVKGSSGNDSLSGADRNDTLYGYGGSDRLAGHGGNDHLLGGSGNDTIDGGVGLDTLNGGTGDDVYILNIASDRVIEAANDGIDTVYSPISCILSANVENIILTGSSNINGTGNALNNVLTSNTGINILSGGMGHDTYLIGAADRVVEAFNAGIDTVKSTGTYILPKNVENLTLLGSRGVDGTGNAVNITLTGNSAYNRLSGLSGNDTINGGAGNDVIDGGLGADRLTGNIGADRFLFTAMSDSSFSPSGRDTIIDFNLAQGDIIDLREIDANTHLSANQDFRYLGSAAFTGHSGELRATPVAGGILIAGDVNGDRIADFALLLNTQHAIGLDSFIL